MSRMLSVRLDEDLYDILLRQAAAEGRSLSNYVALLLQGGVKLMEREPGPIKRATAAERLEVQAEEQRQRDIEAFGAKLPRKKPSKRVGG